MDRKTEAAKKAILAFFDGAKHYIRKEIELSRGQFFNITYNVEDLDNPCFQFQYGFPQSGCVCLTVIAQGKDAGKINRVSVTAPAADKPPISIVYKEEKRVLPELDVSVNFGMNLELDEHETIEAIAANPNAISMIELATEDLRQAKVLGECCEVTSSGSKRLPAGRSK